MLYLYGRYARDKGFAWRVTKSGITDDTTGLEVKFTFPGYSSPMSETVAFKVVEEAVTQFHGAWLKQSGSVLLINGELLKSTFSELAGLTWLLPEIQVLPHFEIVSRNSPSITPGLLGRKNIPQSVNTTYSAEISFYIDQVTVSQKKIFLHPSNIPTEIADSLEKFKAEYPDPNRTGFIMMRFAKTRSHLAITKSIKATLKSTGLCAVRSDDRSFHDDLFLNVLTYIYGCGFGIAVFERIEKEDFNPNVSLEVGYMLGLGKKVCLMKDQTLSTLHSDLIGKLYNTFDPLDASKTINESLGRWLKDQDLTQFSY
jgi:hypothetical protein